MRSYLLAFRAEESGAVTVDWVVLTALAVGLAAITLGIITQGAPGMASKIATVLSEEEVTLGGQ